ncbi:hypothetical protein [Nostoc sp.]|uniref:hypothetical protein n=1 Tax=Nostoc sp. TaxID=1180 RepID=UPI0035934DF1
MFVLTPGRSLVSSVNFSLKPFTDETSKVVLLIPKGRDITDFKQVWEALEKS